MIDSSCPARKGAARGRRFSEQVAVYMRTMGTESERWRDVQQMALGRAECRGGAQHSAVTGSEAQVSGHEADDKADRIQAWILSAFFQACFLLSKRQLADKLQKNRPILLLFGSWWSSGPLLHLEARVVCHIDPTQPI